MSRLWQVFVAALTEAKRRAQERRDRKRDEQNGNLLAGLSEFQREEAVARVRREMRARNKRAI